MKANGSTKITELMLNISFSQRLTIGPLEKKEKKPQTTDERNHGSTASSKKI